MQEHDASVSYSGRMVVIVRALGGEPARRILLSNTADAVFVCREEDYDAIVAGNRPAPMIGFPQDDVFECDEAVFAALADQWARQRNTDPSTWRQLRRYSAAAEP
jgi:hypothetical protein